MLGNTLFPYTLTLLQTEITGILAGALHPGALGVLFQFDIMETGTTTFGEVFVDLEDLSTRQVLYNLRSREVKETKITGAADLITQLGWMPESFKTFGQADLVQVSLVTYKRFDDQ